MDSSRNGDDRYSRSHRDDRGPRDRDDRRDRRRDDDRERRRSRSPRGHRSRRDEPDFYSSSRRENESRRDRRDDRGGWDRDRGPRRDRDDDRRRDFDDRRGGGGRDRRERDAYGGGRREERKRSATPPVKKREPTPDLTDVVPILERQRRMTQWDIKPPGYENITAEQAKLSGMFPLPGAPRQQPMDPQRLQALVSQPQNLAATSALKPTMARQAKRLLVYNIPKSVTEEDLVNFFNLQLNGINLIKSSDPCQAAHISKAGNHALLEFKNPGDATVALALDGISMTDESMDTADGTANGSSGLQVKRPKDYIGPTPSPPSDVQSEEISNEVPDTTEKILITNLAPFLDEEQIKQLLVAIGPLKALALAVDDSGQSRGFAFCEYANPETTNIAFEGLNGMEIGGLSIKLQRACLGQEQVAADMGVNAMSLLAGTVSTTMEKTRVLQMLNMVTPEELIRDDDVEDIREDVVEEVSKFGKVLSIKIPRPAGARTSPGVGKIYVKLETVEAAQKALAALAGRKFGDRTCVITYFSEEYYDVDAW
ncbi:uncharacterized protein PV09_01638 [Verruconis gallopava]|uniref:RRM domain-containing protein n=1 Tax=Verruconis gallopava TaxID=253628 RepID=A0A0D1Z3Z3_9PEZI|nr:uncharacterized protein PV09_01638 [Verruconis gallopava]KIW07702.1 hypothetical protein PV09_01638 [Verruconis gallopava]